MDFFNADLHIHSSHSIGVSKSLNLDTMVETCKKKGLNILATGDVLQPDWLKYLESNLKKERNGAYTYKNIAFILQTEIEDKESVHEIVLFPDFNTVKEIQKRIQPYSKNLLSEWGGRPRVNISPSELVEIISDSGALIGPAHAFTPFKAIFRQNKFESLEECYQGALKHVKFIELGLSANTDLADRLENLKQVTFLSNSDAHSESPISLGREFNRFDIDNPSFEEINLAINRKNDRKIILNVGLHPKLGKYYNMFCSKCRRRVIFKKTNTRTSNIFNQYTISKDFVIYFSAEPSKTRNVYINMVSKEKAICPACKESTKKSVKIKLGVSERINSISNFKEADHPKHRPQYINAIPLVNIIRSVKNIKSPNSKTVINTYEKMIDQLGTEFKILIDIPIQEITQCDEKIASVIEALRLNKIDYTPGGGGTYGQIKLEFVE
ncbi:MAG: endonuclease Q family protein [Candidatus Thorarchaeota archaeon]